MTTALFLLTIFYSLLFSECFLFECSCKMYGSTQRLTFHIPRFDVYFRFLNLVSFASSCCTALFTLFVFHQLDYLNLIEQYKSYANFQCVQDNQECIKGLLPDGNFTIMQESLEKILVFVKATVSLMFICSGFHLLLEIYFLGNILL